jgi:CRP/FNR family transcriptional regulator, cyclic AMP receptor protein
MTQQFASAVDQAELIDLLRGTTPYDTWSEATFQSLARQARKINCPKGHIINADALNGDAFYLLVKGVFELQITVASGRRQLLTNMHPGVLFGLTSVYAAIPSDDRQELVANTESVVWRIPFEPFNDCLLQDRAMLRTVLANLASSTRMLIDEVANCSLLTAHGRVARCLLMSASEPAYHVLGHRAGSLPLRLSQADLARMLGLSRQSVGNILREFESARLVELGRERIELLSPPGLREIVSGHAPKINRGNGHLDGSARLGIPAGQSGQDHSAF